MPRVIVMIFISFLFTAALCKSLYLEKNGDSSVSHSLRKRFINPSMAFGDFSTNTKGRLRMKRNVEEECEKLQLCKLHARSSRNFISDFELYFVNKENAQLWDHHARTIADCEKRFSGCYYR